MNNQKGFASIGILLAIIVGVAVLGGGTYYVMQQAASPQMPVYQEQTYTPPATTQASGKAVAKTQTPTQQPKATTQPTPAPSTSSLVVHGIYSLRATPNLTYLGFHLYTEGPNNPLNDVTTLFFNDESSKPGNLAAPSGSSFAAIAGDLRPRPSCDLEIDATVEIKNPVFENRSGEGIGNYRVVSGDFARLVTRGQVTDVCPVDNGHGGTSYERTPRAM